MGWAVHRLPTVPGGALDAGDAGRPTKPGRAGLALRPLDPGDPWGALLARLYSPGMRVTVELGVTLKGRLERRPLGEA